MVFFDSTKNQKFGLNALLNWGQRFWSLLKEQCRENAALIALCITAYFFMMVAMFILGETNQRSFIDYISRALLTISPMVLFSYGVCRLFSLCFIEKPNFILGSLGRDIAGFITDPRRYARMIPLLLITSFGFIAFITFKTFIPKIIPFFADTTFVEMDRFLHFGKLPTEWLAPLLAMPSLIQGLDFFYKLWYFVMFGFWGWAAWGASDNGWRRQFILAFMLCWIIGGAVFATLLSSVGPCFYGAFVAGENPYEGYMAGLQAIHQSNDLIAVNIQTFMLELYFDNTQPTKIGISAMPSLHNTLAVLFAIVGYKIHRNIGHIFFVYAVIIFIGSVALGWHYAVDGYAGLILAIAMWKLSAWILSIQDRYMGKELEQAAI